MRDATDSGQGYMDRRTPDEALGHARDALARYDEALTWQFRNPGDTRAPDATAHAAEDLAQAFRRLDDLAGRGDLPAGWRQ